MGEGPLRRSRRGVRSWASPGVAVGPGTSGATLGAVRVIEVFADIVCPFTHIGLRRLVEHRAGLGRDDVRLHVRSWPLEIVNGNPVDPAFIAHEIDDLRRQVAGDLFTGFDVAAFPATSLPALALTLAAYEVAIETGEAVALRLRDALFEEGRDVADPAVLAEIAAAYGLDGPASDDAVLADHAEGARRGVIGSPHFFLPDGGATFCPSLDIRKGEAGLRVAIDPQGFAGLVESCFAP